MSAQAQEDALGKAYDARLVRRLAAYARPHRGLIVLSVVLLFAGSAASLTQPWLIQQAIDGYIATGTATGLAVPALLFLATLIVELVFSVLQVWTLEKTGQNVIFDLRHALVSHLQGLPSAFFDRTPVGRLMTRLTSDIESLNEAITSGLILILADAIKLAGIVVILLWMDWRLALVTFAVLPPILVLTWLVRLRVREAYRGIRAAVARLNSFLQENVAGMRIVQLFSRESAHFDEFRELNQDHLRAQLLGVRYESIFSAVAELMGSVTLAAIVWAGGVRRLDDAVTFGTLVAFIEYAGRFFRPVQELSQRYTIMQAAMASAERIFGLLDTRSTIFSPVEPVRLLSRPRGEIAFENVTFGYREDLMVLHDVSFRIAAGERIAVVGWTGSGKSTLIRLLARLYDVQNGRITLDRVDIREYALPDLRRSIGVVLQEPFLFAGTVAENLTLGDPRVQPATARAAAQAVGADRFIERLPGGFEATVHERGSNFSVGEKQLLSFARAIAFDPAVLVLDEATSSVDPETERKLEAALEKTLEGRTAILIAHRLTTVRTADRILVLHQGRLVELGSHEELLRMERGVYRALHHLQDPISAADRNYKS